MDLIVPIHLLISIDVIARHFLTPIEHVSQLDRFCPEAYTKQTASAVKTEEPWAIDWTLAPTAPRDTRLVSRGHFTPIIARNRGGQRVESQNPSSLWNFHSSPYNCNKFWKFPCE